MKYAREALAVSSLSIGILVNTLLFKSGFWKTDSRLQAIGIWIFATGILTYCIFRLLLAIARGGENE